MTTFLLLTYTFLLYSRAFELVSIFLGVPLYIMLLTSAAGLIAVSLTGGLGRVFSTPAGRWLIAFSVWLLVVTPFSQWKGGTLLTLKDEWSRSFAAFVVVAGLTINFAQSRKTIYGLGLAAIVPAVAAAFTATYDGGRMASVGSFGNANLFAFHLLLAVPLIALVILEARWLYKIPLVVAVLYIAVLVLKSGSRGGLLIALVLVMFTVFHVSVRYKILILLSGTLAMAWGLSVASQSALERYRTIFGSREDVADKEAYDSAELSRMSRKYHLMQSLELTIKHPLFGVGPGIFMAASADLSSHKGERAAWRKTHNAYTQVSSEAGIPGLILFMGLLVSAWRMLSRIRRDARRHKNELISNISFCLMLSLLVFMINGLFDSNAYSYYLPLLAGVICGLYYSTREFFAVKPVLPLANLEPAAGTRLPLPNQPPSHPILGPSTIPVRPVKLPVHTRTRLTGPASGRQL